MLDIQDALIYICFMIEMQYTPSDGETKMKTIEIINEKEIVEVTLADFKYDRKEYHVLTIKLNGRKHTDIFKSLAAARNWAQWA